mmetsp:Transcript_1599/g.6313  ORF Transcript_1599/g.6313 Transcript_1599/m.6313 type:complete len:346 (-) Transcript_1599:606-1643(-)
MPAALVGLVLRARRLRRAHAHVLAGRLELGLQSRLRLLGLSANPVALLARFRELRPELVARLSRARGHAREPRFHLFRELSVGVGLGLRLRCLCSARMRVVARRLELGRHSRLCLLRVSANGVTLPSCLRELQAEVTARLGGTRRHARESRLHFLSELRVGLCLRLCLRQLRRARAHVVARGFQLRGHAGVGLLGPSAHPVTVLLRVRHLGCEVVAGLGRALRHASEPLLHLLRMPAALVGLVLRARRLRRAHAHVLAGRLELGLQSRLRLLGLSANPVALLARFRELRPELVARLSRARGHAREPRFHLFRELSVGVGLGLRLRCLCSARMRVVARRLELGFHA